MTLPQNARLCHKCGEVFTGKLCPKCTPVSVLRGKGSLPTPAQMRGILADAPAIAPQCPPPPSKAKRTMEAPKLNKTEQRWQDAHPGHIPFPMSLRWGKCMTYKPDFLKGTRPEAVTLIEVKGGHIFDRDIVRFKGCAAEWGWLFRFEMWQWKDRKWTQLY